MQLKTNLIVLSISTFLFSNVSNAQQLNPELLKLINNGISKSHEIKINDYEIKQSKTDQTIAISTFIPKVTLNGNYTRLDDDIKLDDATQTLLLGTQKLLIKEYLGIPFTTALPDNVPLQEIPNIQDKDILKSSVDVEWVLFSGLEAYHGFKASQLKESSLLYKNMAEKDKLAIKIIDTYDKLGLVLNSKKALEETEKYLLAQENFVRKAIQNGLTTPVDLKKIELAKQQLKAKQLQYSNNRLLLIELLHQQTGTSKEILHNIHPALIPLSISDTLVAEKRNEINALEKAKKAYLLKSKMEISKLIPKIAAKGHYELIEKDLSLIDPKWYVAVGFQWNLFDGFKSSLESKKTRIESYKYEERIDEANEMIALSIIKAELNYKTSLQNISIIEKQIDLANETYRIVFNEYKNGISTMNDVLDEVKNIEQINFKLQEANYNQRKVTVELLYAKGLLTY